MRAMLIQSQIPYMYVQKPLVNGSDSYSDIIAIKYNEKSISFNLKTGSVHVRQSEQTKH